MIKILKNISSDIKWIFCLSVLIFLILPTNLHAQVQSQSQIQPQAQTKSLSQESKNLTPLPPIRTIGVAPLGSIPSSLNIKASDIFSYFDKSVGQSYRFRSVSSSLVEAMFTTKSERKELVSKFEIDAFLKLNIFENNTKDIIFELRLTDVDLNTLMFEQDSYTPDYLNSLSSQTLEEKIRSLVFRFLNRLPYDSLITSVQGDYLTIDIGTNQELKKGDTVNFVRSFIKDLHPLNKSWLSFKNLPLGSGIVEEVKQRVSVVKIINKNADIKVNDGVIISDTVSKKKFNQSESDSNSFTDLDNHSISYPKDESKDPQKEDQTKIQDPKPEDQNALSKKVETPRKEDEYPLLSLLHSLFNLATLEVGINSWQLEKVSAKVPSGFLINNFALHTGKYIEDSIGYDINFDFGFGPTKHGSYWGASLDSDIFWLKSLNEVEFLSNFKVGMGVKNDNLSVSREIFGGWNDFYFRFLLGTENDIDIFTGNKLNWAVNMYIVPAVLGTIGYNKDKRTIQSAMGLFLESLFIFLGNDDAFEYGVSWKMGFMNLETTKYDFKYTSFRLAFCARRSF